MPDDQARPTDEILRDTIYDWLGREFKNVESQLDASGRVDLDGVLWKLSGTLTSAGLWKALQDTVGTDIRF